MQLSNFVVFKNTKFTDMQNTVHFGSNAERDMFFDYQLKNKLSFDSPFNFRRDRGNVRVPMLMDDLQGYNYGYFINAFDSKRYYFFVGGMTYLNDKVTQLEIVIDIVMTYTQGNVLENLQGVEVQRRHLSSDELSKLEEELRCNDDLLPITTLKYVHDVDIIWNEWSVIVQTAVKLDGNYGDENAPKMNTANGCQLDNTIGATDLYVFSYEEFTAKMSELADKPWVTQNIKKATLVPTDFVSNLELNTDKSIMGGTSSHVDVSALNFTKVDLRQWLGINDFGKEDYLIHDGMMTIEVTDYRNHTLLLKPSMLRETTEFAAYSIVGYDNVLEICVDRDSARTNGDSKGLFLDNVLRLDNFDNMPMLIDNTTLNKANTAYQRQIDQQQTLTGKINTLTDSNASLTDRLYSGFSLYSDIFSGGVMGSAAKAAGLLKNEYEYYRNQKAQYKQWGITPPTVTDGSYGSALLRKSQNWGVHMRVAVPEKSEVQKMQRYHGNYGFDVFGLVNDTGSLYTNSICNWLQFTGQWIIPDIDVNFMTQLQTLMEAGVRFFYDYNNLNNYDPKDNTVIE